MRRDCLAVLAAATARSALDGAPAPKVPGVQLYTVRALLKKDPDGTLKALAGIGFRDVEGYDRAATVALAPKIKQDGLTVRSCQVETPLITNNWEPYPDLKPLTLPEAIDSVAGTGRSISRWAILRPARAATGTISTGARRTA